MRTRTLSVAVATATALATMPVANADPAPFTYVELNQPSSQTVAVEAQFNLTADSEVGIAGVRALRADMWDKNVPFNGMPLRDVAAKAGLKTRDDYVNAVQSDYGLSLIALQRGVEASKLFRHERMYNSTCYGDCGRIYTATINGNRSGGENLAPVSSLTWSMKMWGPDERPLAQLPQPGDALLRLRRCDNLRGPGFCGNVQLLSDWREATSWRRADPDPLPSSRFRRERHRGIAGNCA